MSDTKVCTLCQFCLKAGTGYSNWTWLDDELYCLLGLNDAMDGTSDTDLEYNPTPAMAAALDRAKTCERFLPGAPCLMDPDRENLPDPVPLGGYTASSVVAYVTEGGPVADALANWLNNEGDL